MCMSVFVLVELCHTYGVVMLHTRAIGNQRKALVPGMETPSKLLFSGIKETTQTICSVFIAIGLVPDLQGKILHIGQVAMKLQLT